MLTIRSEEKENFRLVSPMMMAMMSDYAEINEGIRNECALNVAEWPLCLECPAVWRRVVRQTKLQQVGCGGRSRVPLKKNEMNCLLIIISIVLITSLNDRRSDY